MIPSNVGTPLYTVPRDVLGHIRSFMTEQLGRTAALACKAFAIADETFLETNSKRIADFVYNPQTVHSNLYALIRPLVDKLYASIGLPPLQNRHHHQLFYDSVRKAVASLGFSSKIPVPTCENIRLISAPIEETFEDEALVKLWKTVSHQLKLTPEDLRLGDAVDDEELGKDIVTQMNAEKIRAWMLENKNRLGTIEELDLSGESLRCLPKEIGFFTGLQELELYGNQLVTLPSTLSNLRDLRILRASCNRLSQLPLAIGELAKLEYLELDHNRLTSVPLELGRLSRLKTLCLKNNYLSALPQTIESLENLECLALGNGPESTRDDCQEYEAEIHGNRIAQLPAQIGALKRLRELYLDGNALRTLPESIMGLESLEVLNLTGNQLEELPEWLGELGKLRILRLTGNKLRALSENVGLCQALIELHLAGNQFRELSFEAGHFPNLKFLDLSSNPLSLLTVKSGALPKLQSLKLCSNPLSTFSLESGSLPSLLDLGLSGVNLTRLPPDIKHLTTLLDLNLENNRLMDLSPEIGCLENLGLLSLKDNQIAVLPPEIVRLKNLWRLDLSFNPLVMFLEPRTLPEKLADLYLDEKQFLLLRPEISQREKLHVWRVPRGGMGRSGFNPYDPDKALEAIWGPICNAAQEAGITIAVPRLVQYDGMLISCKADTARNWLESHPAQVQAITSLNLSGKGIHCLPKEIALFTGLRSLSLARNNIALLPPQMGELANLETLDLSSNQLAALPPGFGELRNLRTLSLSNNRFHAFPQEIAGLPNLNVIMDGNPCARPVMEFDQDADSFGDLDAAAMEIDDELSLGDWLDGESDPKRAKTDE